MYKKKWNTYVYTSIQHTSIKQKDGAVLCWRREHFQTRRRSVCAATHKSYNTKNNVTSHFRQNLAPGQVIEFYLFFPSSPRQYFPQCFNRNIARCKCMQEAPSASVSHQFLNQGIRRDIICRYLRRGEAALGGCWTSREAVGSCARSCGVMCSRSARFKLRILDE